MKIYTIGFTKKSAQNFFEALQGHNIHCLIDVRLNNKSQLAGFTKGQDLTYFLKHLCACDYFHDTALSPSKELLDAYKGKRISWDEYEREYGKILLERNIAEHFNRLYGSRECVCLLCSEAEPVHCHRRLLAEWICDNGVNISISHL